MPPPAELAEVRRAPPLAEQIYLRLKQLLRTGTFAPSERLVESALAQQLSVSRTPVREALSRLAADGFLETRGGGFQVVTPTDGDMAEIFEMRRLLEPPAAVQAAQRGGADMHAQLHVALAQARASAEAGDVTAFAAANSTFREAWASRVPNKRLRETILRFNDQAGLVRRRTLVMPAARTEALAMLETITAAFDSHDEAAVLRLTAQFVDAAERFFRLAGEAAGAPDDSSIRRTRKKS
jgi:DNA-binding GntR family transcriptional regulator